MPRRQGRAEAVAARHEAGLEPLPFVAPAVTVRLTRDRSAGISGIVIDAGTRATIEGVAVSIEGRKAVLTGPDGTFSLPAFAAEGEQVRLRAEKDGFQPDFRYRMAGGNSVTSC